MPTYKYKCRDCENAYTVKLTISEKNEADNPPCPECEGENVFQLFDSIGVVGGSSSCSQSSCSGCSGC